MALKRNENGEIAFSEAQYTPQGSVRCRVILEATNQEIPFTASPSDDTEHGQELWAQLSVSDQVSPCPDEVRYAEADREARSTRAELLSCSDWTQLPDVPQATTGLWTVYRQELRDITTQEGYPYEITWPVPPT